MKELHARILSVALVCAATGLGAWPLTLTAHGSELEYTFDAKDGRADADIPSLLRKLGELGIAFKDLHTTESSLEDIFVSLVHDGSKSE